MIWCYSVDGGDSFTLADSFDDALRTAMTCAQELLAPHLLDEVEVDIRLAQRGATHAAALHLADVVRNETESGCWLVPTPPRCDELRMAFEAVLERLCPMLRIDVKPKLRLTVEESFDWEPHEWKDGIVVAKSKSLREFKLTRIGGDDEHLAKARALGWEIGE